MGSLLEICTRLGRKKMTRAQSFRRYNTDTIVFSASDAFNLDSTAPSLTCESQDAEESEENMYDVFRNKFHVPQEWVNNPKFEPLLTHKYAVNNVEESSKLISRLLKDLGYVHANNNMMIHDYLHFMLIYLLKKNGEVFITERDLKQLEDVRKLLNNTNPDFVIRSRGERRTTIVDIYVGAKDITDLKSKYKKLEFFADFKIITKDNFSEQLQHILPAVDLAYLHRNLQIFLVKHKYWCSCMKMQKHLFNENTNLQVPEFEILKNDMFEEYKGKLTTYAQNVLNQEGI